MSGLSLGLGLGLSPRNKGVGFSLPAFMAGQSDKFWYAFTSPDRMFQENVGPTPANDPSEVIGLAPSQATSGGQTFAAYLAAQPELVTNGAFGSDTAWTKGTGWAISGGVASNNAPGGPSNLTQNLGLVAGRLYAITFTLSVSAGNLAAYAGFSGTSSGPLAVNGTYTRYLTAGGDAQVYLQASAAFVGSVDNVSVKEVSRYPASQAAGSFKPTVQAGGAKGDATDDRHGTGFASASGDAFNVYPAAIIPATLAATQVFAGAMDGSSNGDYLAITTGGALRAKVGATTLDSTGIDLRGGTHDLAYWTDGATLYLYADGAIVASGPWTGSRPTTTWNLFALNNNGTPSNFTGATMKAALRGAQALTVSLANQICRAA